MKPLVISRYQSPLRTGMAFSPRSTCTDPSPLMRLPPLSPIRKTSTLAAMISLVTMAVCPAFHRRSALDRRRPGRPDALHALGADRRLHQALGAGRSTAAGAGPPRHPIGVAEAGRRRRGRGRSRMGRRRGDGPEGIGAAANAAVSRRADTVVGVRSRFDRDTAVTALPDGRLEATMSPGWWIERGPNGGYVAAVVLRALSTAPSTDADRGRRARSPCTTSRRRPRARCRSRSRRSGRAECSRSCPGGSSRAAA